MSVFKETLEGETNQSHAVNQGAVMQMTSANQSSSTMTSEEFREECADLGNSRQEWIRLINQAIKKCKFLSKDGVRIAVAMLQNM